MPEKCLDCGGWVETDYLWNGDVGYPCACIQCPICGESYGCSEEDHAWNSAQWELHIVDHPLCYESNSRGAHLMSSAG